MGDGLVRCGGADDAKSEKVVLKKGFLSTPFVLVCALLAIPLGRGPLGAPGPGVISGFVCFIARAGY